jgi:autotransporter-associated beta strand protein
LTLSGTNSYIGATSVTRGILLIDGSTSGSSAVSVSAGTATETPVAKLGGSGTIGGNVSLSAESASGFKNGGVLAPTAAASGTKLSVTGTTDFNTGSIFEWDMSASDPANDPGNNTANSGSYGQLAGTGAISGGDAVFKIVLGAGNAFTDAFWDTNKTWNNIFTGAGATNTLTSIFSSISGAGITFASGQGTVDGQGYFTLNGTSTLNWTAVPEPTSALAGLLLTAGLLRRRRSA